MTVDPLVLLIAQLLAARGETPSVAPVQVKDDETVVTARKTAETLADVPLSISVVDEGELTTQRLLTVRDAASRVPNVFFSEFTARRLSFPFVRGVGSGLGDPAVITYVDDVPQFGFGGTNLPLVGIERVEFLRGPQGTLYGKNALGGLIHVHGRRPTSEVELGLSETFGNDDLLEHSLSVSGPLGGGVLGDLAILDSERDGYTTNDFTGNTVDDRDGTFGRARVLWSPSEDSELDFTIFGERARDGGFALSFLEDTTVRDFSGNPVVMVNGLRDRPHRVNQDFEGRTERDVVNPALVWRVFGDQLDFTSISSFEAWDLLETTDFDFTTVDGVRRRTTEEQSYVYQELRLGSSRGERTGEFTWLAGASGFLSDAQRSAANDFRPGGAGIFFPPASVGIDDNDGDFDDLGVALFGHVSIPIGGRLAFDLGLRYDREEKEAERVHTFDPGGGPFVVGQDSDEETFDELLPMGGPIWHVTESALLYLRAARGFKAGGFNLTAPAGQEDFDAETNWTYELGYRHSFDEERHELAASVFWIDWEDMQLSLFDPMAGGFVDNAGESESRGFELEGHCEIIAGLESRASFGFLDTEIEEFVDSFGTDTSGNDLPQAPETTWSLGLQYGREFAATSRWYVRADYQNVGDFSFDAGNRDGDSFDLVNAGLGLDTQHFGLSVWVQNLFEEEYVPIAFQPNPGDPTVFAGESGAPRVLGFTLSAHL